MRSLTEHRIKKGEQAVRNSDDRHEVFFITQAGYIRREVVTPAELEERGYYWDDMNSNVFFEGATNPIDEIEWSVDDEWDEGEIDGFIPCDKWKQFRDTKAIEEALHRKTDRDIPWRMLLVLGLVALAALVITQGGFI